MTTSFSYWPSSRIQIACIILFVSSSLFSFPVSESISFKITNFATDATNMIYTGDAMPTSGIIEFNRVDDPMRVGHANYADAVQIWDSRSGKLSDFNTRFTFIIDTLEQTNYGDAFAFFLAPVGYQIPPNSAGAFLGLFNTTTAESPQNQMIVVEFDSVANSWDPPYRHVGININSVRSVNNTAWNTSSLSGGFTDAWVSYNATTQMLGVSWRNSVGNNITNEKTTVSYRVDIGEVLPEWVTIGFSGTTGFLLSRHVLQSWEFSSSLNNTVSKMKDDPNKNKNKNKRKLAMGFTIPLSVIIVVGVIVSYAIFRRRGLKKPIEKSLDTIALMSINDEDLERGAGPKRFSFWDLAMATNNFPDDQKLGEGGFGCVYRGYLSRERILVAVKRISQGSKQGKKEYITEVKIISNLRHRNLVQLIGWCHDQSQFLLVYEFMPNGSLDSHLFGKKNPLEWGVRYKIATGLASALLYLHEECEQCVLHRDIKASNIMLDSGFNSKLGDFGLARLMDHELGQRTTGLAGTLGYISPEYVTTGKASKESDVYSFGVVVLEIACGRKAMDRVDENSDLGLVQWVWDLLGKGELVSGVDQMLRKVFDEKEAVCLMMVGLWCAHPDQSLRPSIRQAIQVLKFEAAVPNLPVRMPVPVYYVTPADAPKVSSSSATMTNSSIDQAR